MKDRPRIVSIRNLNQFRREKPRVRISAIDLLGRRRQLTLELVNEDSAEPAAQAFLRAMACHTPKSAPPITTRDKRARPISIGAPRDRRRGMPHPRPRPAAVASRPIPA